MMIDSVYEEIAPGKSRNTMKVETLRRGDLGAEFTCFGNNNNDTQPVANTVRLKLNRECTMDHGIAEIERELDPEISAYLSLNCLALRREDMAGEVRGHEERK